MKVYLDNGATTKVDEKVVKKMIPYFNEKFGNRKIFNINNCYV